MSTNNHPSVDWVNLPNAVASTSLWESVHDGDLRSIKSEVLQRSLHVAFEVAYLYPEDEVAKASFSFAFEGVQSVRVLKLTIWPGKFEFPDFRDRENSEKSRDEFRRLCRQET